MTLLYQEIEVRRELKRICGESTIECVAFRLNLSEAYIKNILEGYCAPSSTICKAVGFEKVVRYRRLENIPASANQ